VDNFLQELVSGATGQLKLHILLLHFFAFLLVLIRMAGLMTIGPVFGQRIVSRNIRVLIAFSLALVITPTLNLQSQMGFQKLDANEDGVLQKDEIPKKLQSKFRHFFEDQANGQNGVPRADFEFHILKLKLPSTILDFVWLAVGEFSLGLVLGTGMLIVFSGFQLAGELIDQQTGIALGEISNPGLEINGSVTGQTLFMFATTLLLIMEPINGHLMLLGALIETFQTLPVGEAFVTESTVHLLRDLVHESLILGVQVAAPIIAIMSLVALTMGFLGHTVPQINVLVIGFPIRALVSLTVLALSFSGIARKFVDLVPMTIDTMSQSLWGG